MLELLEDRTLPAITLNPTTWTAIGPAPINGGQLAGGADTGPVSGRLTGIAVDPTNSSTIYLATAGGGVWKTTDAGATWNPLTDNLTDSSGNLLPLFMGAITVDPVNPNIIYAGTGESNNALDSFYGVGVLKSINGGSTWSLITNGGVFNKTTIQKIVVDPSNDNNVYVEVNDFGTNGVRTGAGIYLSNDGGANWTNTTSTISTFQEYSDLVIDPNTTSTLYMAVGTYFGNSLNGIYQSTNSGGNWNLLTGTGTFNGTQDGRIALALSSDSSTLYASIAYPTSNAALGGQLYKMLKSTDGGTTFTDLTGGTPNYMGATSGGTNFGQGWYDTSLAVQPGNASVVFAGGSMNGGSPGVIESTNGGTSWSSIKSDGTLGPHSDSHAMAFDAQTASGKLLEGDDGGIFRLVDPTIATLKWADLNTNQQITQFTGISLDPTNANIVYGGSQDNGTEKFTGSLGWSLILKGDGGFTRVDPFNVATVYGEQTNISLKRSDNSGTSFAAITAGPVALSGNSNFYAPYVLDPSTSGRVLWGSDSLFESLNKGGAWTVIAAPGVNGFTTKVPVNPPSAGTNVPIDAIAVAPSDPKTIYVTARGDIFVTTNGTSGAATTWTQIDVPGFSDTFNAIAVDPTDSQTAYIVRNAFSTGAGGHVFMTSNGGTTWTDISGDLPNVPTDSIVIDTHGTTASRVVYIGTDTGVYATDNGGTNWVPYQTGLPNTQVVGLEYVAGLNNILAAATHGRGVYEIQADLIANNVSFTATEGVAFTGTVANFRDTDGDTNPAHFSATIFWGDSTSSAGTVVYSGTPGNFTVDASGTPKFYAEEGPYTNVHVTITDTPDSASTSTTNTSTTVLDAPLTITKVTPPKIVVLGVALKNVNVATFTDANINPDITDLSATINWGDGTGDMLAKVKKNANGTFSVIGSHTYKKPGHFTLTVKVFDLGGAMDMKSSKAGAINVRIPSFLGDIGL